MIIAIAATPMQTPFHANSKKEVYTDTLAAFLKCIYVRKHLSICRSMGLKSKVVVQCFELII